MCQLLGLFSGLLSFYRQVITQKRDNVFFLPAYSYIIFLFFFWTINVKNRAREASFLGRSHFQYYIEAISYWYVPSQETWAFTLAAHSLL